MEKYRKDINRTNEAIDNLFDRASRLMNKMTEIDKLVDKMRDGENTDICTIDLLLQGDGEMENTTKSDTDVKTVDEVMNTWIINEICSKFEGIRDQQETIERLEEMISKLPEEDIKRLETTLMLDHRQLRIRLIQAHRRKTRNDFFQVESCSVMDEVMEIIYHQMKKHFDNDSEVTLPRDCGKDNNIYTRNVKVLVESEEAKHLNLGSPVQDRPPKMARKNSNSILKQIRTLSSRILNAFVGTKNGKSKKVRKEKRNIFSCIKI